MASEHAMPNKNTRVVFWYGENPGKCKFKNTALIISTTTIIIIIIIIITITIILVSFT